MILLFLSFFVGWTSPPLYTDGESHVPPVEVLAPGREAMMAFRLDEAERYFQQWVSDKKVGFFARYHLTTIAYWRALAEETPAAYDLFLFRAKAFIQALKQASATPWRSYFLAETYLQRALIQANRGRYLKAVWDGKRAFSLYRHTVSRWPDFYDAYKGLGLLHVIVGAVPRTYRWLLGLFGYSGSVEGGMRELEQAARRSYLGREEAQVYMALVDLILTETQERGEARLRKLHETHPWSPLAGYLYAFSLLKNRKAVEAEQILWKVEHQLQQPGYTSIPFVAYYLGEALFRQNRFGEAVTRFQHFLEIFQGESLVPLACVKIGLSLEMQGKYEEALVWYRRLKVRRDFDTDHWAQRVAQERLQRPMTAAERLLLQGANAYDGGRYQDAVALLHALLEDEQIPEALRTEAAYRLGRTYQALGAYREAFTYYRYAVTHPVDSRAKWSPWAQFYLGELAELQGDTLRARAAYEAALRWKGPFDYEKALEQRARIALARLR